MFIVKRVIPEMAEKALLEVGFDNSYIEKATPKYKFGLYKIYGLTSPQATIVKQLALSVGADAAVHRDVITCETEKSDVILACSDAQLSVIAKKLKKQPFKLSILSESLLLQLKKHDKILEIRGNIFDWTKNTYIMGILNVTPDSFSDGGKFYDHKKAVEHALQIIENGADIIDIGAESTRPFATPVSADEETQRAIPIIEKIRKLNPKIPISIDTRNSKTAKEAFLAGADIINDVSGLKWDSKMTKTAAELGIPIIIMHSSASPETMQIDPVYPENVVDSIYKWLLDATNSAINEGIKHENIIIDPGIGFGKTFEHNLEIIRRISEFKSLGFPLMTGVSRKSLISKIIGMDSKIEDRDDATLALNSYIAASAGVNILRVHDVRKHRLAFNVIDKVLEGCF